ncbi:MAG TPA: pilus assembly protein PilN [Gammaproteobacteria bacterium]|nr:pilus assembly protein PilN [Gammaproteobacteria bacterium]|tara:strand:- start:1355 stop:1918 length:564 start_codon:yes stop_codon:yes gene_type:complete
MINGVNLLPWREERRQRQRRRATAISAVLALITAAILGGAWWSQDRDLIYQQSRNEYLRTAIAEVEEQLQEINKIEERKEALLTRMVIIRQLQSERVTLVRGMIELATTIPEGVFFSSLQRSPEGISLTGVAQSSSRISALMEQLTNTPSFDQPELNVINVGDTQEFELWVLPVRPDGSLPVSGKRP